MEWESNKIKISMFIMNLTKIRLFTTAFNVS